MPDITDIKRNNPDYWRVAIMASLKARLYDGKEKSPMS